MSEVILLQSPPPKLEEVQKKIFSVGALEFLANLHKEFDEDIDQLYKNRRKRSVELHTSFKLDFKKSPERLDRSWTIAPLPFRLQYIDGKEAIGPLVDFAILMYHNAKKLYEANSGPYFYLSKLEGAGEAKLWNNIFIWAQHQLGIPQGTIKACVLIENIISTFEMEEILYALREHSLGLNCGIWDYCASIISKFEFLLPDRNKYVNMDRHFLSSYMRLVIATCHARAAPATGGMAAATLRPGADAADKESKEVINKILDAKLKEIEAGVDGFMVYDSRVVPHVNEITAEDLLTIPSGGVTLQGLRHNVAVSIMFIYHWLAGIGHFFYNGNVEDSATAEISRTQIWQWIRFAPFLEDDPKKQVTAKLVEKAAASFSAHAHKNLCRSNAERKRLTAARYMSIELFLARNPPELF
ncbi:hypothetical protein MSG28_009262 [Choristoneura fumiferana]|uniref:Uncharacterized protein n=1 Tax=Choristoneura fumiferana TaxID=7141 RepID=A0ACC0KWN3_CHOFU|nr:hypothetical protein MSG28_009262 [Choristoneura fumiferana]